MSSSPTLLAQERYELLGIVDNGVGGAADADSRGTTLTANAASGSDGAYTQLVAATAFDYDGFWVYLSRGFAATSTRSLIDVSIGAAGVEKIILADLPLGGHTTGSSWGLKALFIPVHIPSGSRVAARIHRSSVNSATCDISVMGVQGGPWAQAGFTRCTTYGTDLATFKGTQVDPGATINTRGAVAQIVASTTNPIRCFYVITGRAQTGTSNTTDNNGAVDILHGPATEKLLVPYLSMGMTSGGDIWEPECFGPFWVNLPSAIRLSSQAQANTNTANAREFHVTIIAFD